MAHPHVLWEKVASTCLQSFGSIALGQLLQHVGGLAEELGLRGFIFKFQMIRTSLSFSDKESISMVKANLQSEALKTDLSEYQWKHSTTAFKDL